jgi:adenosine/AMP kinase
MEIKLVQIEQPEGLDVNIILGQSHFIKTVEDIHEAMVNAVPGIKFGVAFCEASTDMLVRCSGTDEDMINLAKNNAYAIAAGHSFIVFMRDAFPINVLNAIKMVPEVCTIIAATANPLQVLVAETEQGRGIIGVIDGERPRGIETPEDAEKRKQLVRRFGYKL